MSYLRKVWDYPGYSLWRWRRLGVYSIELVPGASLRRLCELAGLGERLSFQGVWLSEHIHNRSSIVAGAYLLNCLTRAWVGVGLLNPYLHKPPLMAQVAATLSEAAPGRIRLLIGAGDRLTLKELGIGRRRPLIRVEEALKIVRSLLAGEVYEEGDARMRLDFRPIERLPIYVGAQGEGMLRLGARLGDGVLVNYSRPEDLRRALDVMRDEAGRCGRSWGEIDAAAFLTVSVDEDESRALQAALPYSAYILLGSSQAFREKYGVRDEDVAQIRDAVLRRDWPRLREVMPRDYVEYVALVGTMEKLAEKVAEIRSAGYRHIVFGAPLGPEPEKALRELRTLAERVEETKIEG